jgi:WD40 repeat protein
VEHAAVSPDGRRIALAHGRSVSLWDAETGALVWERAAPGIWHAAFSPDGAFVFTGGTHVRVWRRDDGALVSERTAEGWSSARLSADGEEVLVMGGTTLELLRLSDGASLWRRAMDRPLNYVHFAGEDLALAQTGANEGDGGIVVLDAATGEILRRYDEPVATRGVFLRDVSRDGAFFLTASQVAPHDLTLWRVADGSKVWVRFGETSVAISALSPNGTEVFTGGSGAEIAVRRLDSGAPIAKLSDTQMVTRLAFGPGGRQLLVTEADGAVRLLDPGAPDRPPVDLATGPKFGWDEVVYAPGGDLIATVDQDVRIQVLTVHRGSDGALLYSRPFPWYLGRNFAFSPDGTLLATGGNPDGRVHLLRSADGALVRRLDTAGTRVGFTADGTRLAVANGGASGGLGIRLFRVSDGQEEEGFAPEPAAGTIGELTFSADGRWLAFSVRSSTKVELQLWSLPARRLAWRSSGYLTAAAARISSDGRFLAFSSTPAAEPTRLDTSLLDLHALPLEPRALPPEAGGPHEFTPDARFLATGGRPGDGKLLFWRLGDGRPFGPFGHAPFHLAFAPAGGELSVVSGGRLIRSCVTITESPE